MLLVVVGLVAWAIQASLCLYMHVLDKWLVLLFPCVCLEQRSHYGFDRDAVLWPID
jgi:hypothetical protein